jgi:hypothetical protein
MNSRPMVPVVMLVAIFVSACASSQANPPVELSAGSQRISTPQGTGTTIGGPVAAQAGIAARFTSPPDSVFAALQSVYREIAVPLTIVDPAGRQIGNQSLRTRRRLGGAPMQSYLDCGGSSGQPNAETYDISLSLLSYVTVAGKEVTLVTRMSATANDATIGRGNAMNCSTTGELEKRIETMTRAKLNPIGVRGRNP